ncbi:hypothetical protein DFP94_109102 [Fontibacillus phaseoli]|uniref:Hemerythrin HHE cation binding domain-containing protein n=1 Tax=Fontibacillus phaseoli TaxID=1416533 RepID=A0A369B9V4_9BACL|nr:hypothetical protein [Fontibacillus phaseoli]RCX17378.1 hypothetical protein DFP94_109102 [Fontibacillus phaseoli]
MSGPALKNVDSHTSIHEAALEEARELTELFGKSLRQGEREKSLELAYITLEHWETRTLQHALSEEEGLYVEAVNLKPELQPVIISLTRDHDLLRQTVQEIRLLLAGGEVSEEILYRFQALIVIDQLHNRDEMEMLEKEIEGVLHDHH